MMKDNVTRIHRQFHIWLIILGIIFAAYCIGGLVHVSSCPPQNDDWTANLYEKSNNNYYIPYNHDEIGYISAHKNVVSGKENNNSNEKNFNNFQELFCLVEIKFSDFIVALLTACLVLITWYQMRVADETSKRTERAYIVGRGDYFSVGNIEKAKDPSDTYPPTGEGWKTFRQIEFNRTEHLGKYFFGVIRYMDVFKESHYSAFKMRLDEKFSPSIGDTHAIDWD